jgi:hypothetical protein
MRQRLTKESRQSEAPDGGAADGFVVVFDTFAIFCSENVPAGSTFWAGLRRKRQKAEQADRGLPPPSGPALLHRRSSPFARQKFLQQVGSSSQPPLSFICFHSGLRVAGNRFFAPAARRDSKKIQPKGPRRGQKRMRKGAAELIFFWVTVRAYRNPLPAAKKVRAIEIAIAILPHKMYSSHSCFVCL